MAGISKSKTSTGGGKTPITEAIVTGTTGDDTFFMVDAKYRGYYSSVVAPTINGDNGKDILYGRDVNEIINGGSGSDWINGGGGNDVLDGGGGTGVDWLSFQPYKYLGITYNAYLTGITVNIASKNLSFDAFGGAKTGTATNFENVFGSDGYDSITGDARGNEIRGGSGDDLIVGGDGADVLHGDDGNDVVVGGTWRPDIGLEPLREDQMRGTGNDNNVLFGGKGDDVLVSAVGNDWIDGGDGTDVADYSYLPEGFQVRVTLIPGGVWAKATVYRIDEATQLEVVYENDWIRNVEGLVGGRSDDTITGDPTKDNTIEAGPGKDTVVGGTKDDYLDGGADDDNIDAGDGNDVIDGGTGNDSMNGGNGTDLLLGGGGGNDSFNGGGGTDTISFAPVPGRDYEPCEEVPLDNRSLVIDLGQGQYAWRQMPEPFIWSGSVTEIENAIGSHCSDEITGDSGSNVLDGGEGNDVLRGRGGDDTLRGGQGNDWASFQNPLLTPGEHFDNNEIEPATAPTSTIEPALMSLLSAQTVDPAGKSIESPMSALLVDAYTGGITADLSTDGGWYDYRGLSGINRLELTGVENLQGSVGNDELTGDAVAYTVITNAMATLGEGDSITFTYEGTTYKATLGAVTSPGVPETDPTYDALLLAAKLVALQTAIDNAVDVSDSISKLGSGKVLADAVNVDADLRLRVVDATTGGPGTTDAVTLTDGIYINSTSDIKAREFVDSTFKYLAFEKLVPQLSNGDEFTFTVGGSIKTVSLDLEVLKLFGESGYDETALVDAINSALTGTGVTADIVNGTDVLFRSTSALTLGTFANCLFSEDTEAGVDNIIQGDAGIDTIRGGMGQDSIDGGMGNDTIDGGDGDDVINGDGGAYIVIQGVVSTLSVGDVLTFTYNGIDYEVTLATDGIAGVQAELDKLLVYGVKLNAYSPNDVDLHLRLVELTQSEEMGPVLVNRLISAAYTDTDSATLAAESDTEGTYALTFTAIASQLSTGDRFTFSVDGTSISITLTQTPTNATSLNALIAAALNEASIAASVLAVLNGDDVELRSATALTAGTFLNPDAALIQAVDAGGDDEIFGGTGNDIIHGGNGFDTLEGGEGDDTIDGGGGKFNKYDAGNYPGNLVTGGNGSDTFRVGFNLDGTAVAATDIITDWDDQDSGTLGSGTLGRDSLYVSTGGTAIISALAGQANWSGNDRVDLRGDIDHPVDNDGRIVVFTGAGNDTIDGSNGDDWIYAGIGANNIHLGSPTDDGADRVYISSFQTNNLITGFDSADTIYIDRTIVDAFAEADGKGKVFQFDLGVQIDFEAALRGDFGNFINFGAASDWVDRADPTLTTYYFRDDTGYYTDIFSDPNNYRNVLLEPGQEVDAGLLSSPIYNLVYDATVQALGQYYGSNGAYTNFAHEIAYVAAQASIAATAAILLGIGIGLSYIPIIGNLIAIPFFVAAGILTYEIIVENEEHLNPLYIANAEFLDAYFLPENGGPDAFGGTIDTGSYSDLFNEGDFPYLTFMKTLESMSGSADQGERDYLNFLDFYAPPDDRFVPSLEIANGVWEYAPFVSEQGVYTIAALQTGRDTAGDTTDDKTFLYLVSSPDHLIQNNETILLAEVDGWVSPNQIKFYDSQVESEHTQYGGDAFVKPLLPPIPTVAFITGLIDNPATTGVDESIKLGSASTAATAAELLVTLAKAPDEAVTIKVYRSGSTEPIQTWSNVTTAFSGTLTVDLTALDDGQSYTYQVVVEGSQGIQKLTSIVVTRDLKGPTIESFAVSEAGISFSADENIGAIDGYVDANKALDDTIASPSRQARLTVEEQASVVTLSNYKVFDEAGNPTSIATGDQIGETADYVVPIVKLGTSGIDTESADATKGTVIYGFRGNDILTGGAGGDFLFGGADNDTLSGQGGGDVLAGGAGTDTITAGEDSDLVEGGAGADTIDLTEGTAAADTVIVVAKAGISSDSGNGAADTVTAFGGEDTLLIRATEVSNYSHTLDAKLSGTTLTIDLGGNGQDAGDIEVGFSSSTFTQARIQYDLKGTSGDDMMTGGEMDDRLAGGAGSNTIAGGAGKDSIDLAESSSLKDVVVVSAQVGVSSDSSATSSDTVSGFNAKDVLLVMATGVSNFDHTTDAAATESVVALEPEENKQATLSVDLNGGGLGAGDVSVAFSSGTPTVTQIQYDLTGTANADTLKGGSLGDVLNGGVGTDTLVGRDGEDTLVGGTGVDSIDLYETTDSKDVVLVEAVVGGSSDSYEGAADTVTGFAAKDVLLVVATGVTDFDHSEGAAVTGSALTVDLNGGGLGIGDVKVEFSGGTAPSISQIQYDLTGTSGADTLGGGDLDDRLTGGVGQDSLTGGAGDDTFVFDAGDSTTDAATCDVINDLTGGDKIDLSAISTSLNLIMGVGDTPFTSLADVTYTSGFDAFVYNDTGTGASYLVYETVAAGASATDQGSYEMIQIVGSGVAALADWSSSGGVISIAAA